MKHELQQKLLKKYAHFFPTDRKIYTGEKTVENDVKELLKQEEIVMPIQFGFDCGDGWFGLISELMSTINSYIKNYNKWTNPENSISIQITQIKEKWGGLRFYYYGGDEQIAGMVHLAENLSYDICENCGSPKNIGRTQGWIKTLCQECGKNDPTWELYDEDKEDENELL